MMAMENCQNRRMGTVAYRLTGRHASFIRFCKLFDIDLGKQFDKDSVLSNEVLNHLNKYEMFARLYEGDYYASKTPKSIALFLNRREVDVLEALKSLRPNFFKNFAEGKSTENSLKYFSSFEVDKYLGADYSFLKFTGKEML